MTFLYKIVKVFTNRNVLQIIIIKNLNIEVKIVQKMHDFSQ